MPINNSLPLDERLSQIHDNISKQGIFHDWEIEKQDEGYGLTIQLHPMQVPKLDKAELRKFWAVFSGKGWGSLRDVSKNKRKTIKNVLKTSLRGDLNDANYFFRNKIALNYWREVEAINSFLISAAGTNILRYNRIAKDCNTELIKVDNIEERCQNPNWSLVHEAFKGPNALNDKINILNGEKPVTYEYNTAHNRYDEARYFDTNAKKIKIYEISAKQKKEPFNSHVQETFARYLESDLLRKEMKIATVSFTNGRFYSWQEPFPISASLADVVNLKDEAIDTFDIFKKIGKANLCYIKDAGSYKAIITAKRPELIQQAVKKVA